MLHLGLTGGIASGKSAAARYLADKGALHLDLDAMAHAEQSPGRPAWQAVVDAFGPGILRADDTIDRQKLGRIVFADPERLAALNACVHPAVLAAWAEQLQRIARETPDAIVVSEVPLLIEAGLANRVDRVVLVACSPEIQEERLMRRNGLSRSEARARLAAQMPLSEKRRFAHIVVPNDTTLKDLFKQLDELWVNLLEESRLRQPPAPPERP